MAPSHSSSTSRSGGTDAQCNNEMVNADCDGFFKKNSVPESFKRDCSASTLQDIGGIFKGVFQDCAAEGGSAWKKWGNGIVDATKAMRKKIEEDSQKYDAFAKKCENATENKSQIKKEINLIYDMGLSDAQVERMDCSQLLGLSTVQGLKGSGGVVQQDRALKELQAAREAGQLKPGQANPKDLKKIYAAANVWFRTNIGVPMICYNVQKQVDLLCYGAASFMTPDTLVGVGVAAKLKKIAGLGEALKGANIEGSVAKAGPRLADDVTKIRGEDHRRLISQGGDDTLSKVIKKFDKDGDGVEVYAKKFSDDEADTAAYATKKENEVPAIVLRENILEDGEKGASTIAHEATHIRNTLRAADDQELGSARTIKFSANNDVLLNDTGSYDKYMRVDEVHAYTVDSGVSANRAAKSLDKGNQREALDHYIDAKISLEDARKFQKISRDFLKAAHYELFNPKQKRSWYSPATGEMQIHFTSDLKKMKALLTGLEKKQSGAMKLELRKMGDAIIVKIKVRKQLSDVEAKIETERILERALKDLERFDKTFDHNERLLNRLDERGL